jgi:hypothetical protein
MDANTRLMDLSVRSSRRFFDTPFDDLTVPEKTFVSVWTLEADVNNGGFDQYYFNSAGDYAWYAPGALRRIGAEATAAIVEQANARFGPEGPPPDSDARQDRLEELPDEGEGLWEDCDQAFYAYPDDLATLLEAFVESHRAEIQGAA